MENGYMAWWYWFGMWIFGITSLVLTWWLFLDAVRRNGLTARFIWPALTAVGVVAQIPAYFFMGKVTTAAADGAAMLGIFGFVIALIGAVTYFSKGATRSGGSGWTMTTRNESVDPSRIRSGGPKPSVPVGEQPPIAPGAKDPRERTRPGATGAPANRIPGNTAPGHAGRRSATPLPGSAVARASSPYQPVSGAGHHNDSDPTVVDVTIVDGTLSTGHTSSTISEGSLAATVMDDAAPTVIDETAPAVVNGATLGDGAAATVIEDSDPTTHDDAALETDEIASVAEEAASTIAEDSGARFAPEIVLTDGVARRVVITDRGGSFIVGRDPSKANLAVDDPRASRGHFSITHTDGHYYLNDLGSSNGTFVNGAQARGPVRLFPGDSIEFGRTTAQFRIS